VTQISASQSLRAAQYAQYAGNGPQAPAAGDQPTREAFNAFVGETFFSQMLKSMRKTVGKPAYLHGGRAEEVFTQQLDQVLAEKLGKSSASTISGPMYELFAARRK
jgi:peptidoglycan hydrolase FlgJ